MNRDDGKRKFIRVHRLVAQAYVEGYSEECNVVDHIDRNKFNNHYSNLRWVDVKGNQRNLETNIYVGDQLLKDFVLKYENPSAAYSYLLSNSKVVGMKLAIEKYEKYLEFGIEKKVSVEYGGETQLLFDLCIRLGKDYEGVYRKIRMGYPVWNALYNIKPISSYPSAFILSSKYSDGIWIPSIKYLEKEFKYGVNSLQDRLKEYSSYEDLINYDRFDYLKLTVNGITGSREELCKYFGKTISSVRTRVTKGMTFEEALLTPAQRIKKITINGVSNTAKYWYESFGLDYKKVKKYRDRHKPSFEDTLVVFGVDISRLEISYGD